MRNLRTKAGAKITPEITDALAAEAERGYDLSKAERRRVGRPSLAGTGTSPRLSFRTTPDLYRAAQKRAKEEGRSVSDLAREAVARYVDPVAAKLDAAPFDDEDLRAVKEARSEPGISWSEAEAELNAG